MDPNKAHILWNARTYSMWHNESVTERIVKRVSSMCRFQSKNTAVRSRISYRSTAISSKSVWCQTRSDPSCSSIWASRSIKFWIQWIFTCAMIFWAVVSNSTQTQLCHIRDSNRYQTETFCFFDQDSINFKNIWILFKTISNLVSSCQYFILYKDKLSIQTAQGLIILYSKPHFKVLWCSNVWISNLSKHLPI